MRAGRQVPLHAAADAIEPRFARAVAKAARRMRQRVSINALAHALHAKDPRAALALLPVTAVKEALAPASAILRDAVLRGGRIGGQRIAAELEG